MGLVRSLVLCAACLACVDGTLGSTSAPRHAQSENTPSRPPVVLTADIRSVLSTGTPGWRDPQAESERVALEAVYRTLAYAPLWLDTSGRPTMDAEEAIALLRGADTDGLQPSDYRVDELGVELTAARATLATAGATGSSETRARLATLDVNLTRAVTLYLRHLHTGRVTPAALGFRVAPRPDEHDFAALVADAVMGHRLRSLADSLVPPLALYRNLRARLADYRLLAADTSMAAPPTTERSVHPGEPYPGVAALHRLLVAVGDVRGDTPVPEGQVYQGALVDGVARFQRRHGLTPDGVLGRATQQALGVPLRTRVQQMEWSLERLRWLPHIGPGPLVAVNIPMFRLWAWDSVVDNPVPQFDMGVIVGRAVETQTPVFIEQMREVIFRPYWNVPLSIVRQEIASAVARTPDYLERQNMEIVAGPGDASPTVVASSEALARLTRGEWRVRQRPGPGNALGLVKFNFPNDESVYMHGTPAQELFARARRDFSHGCIRLEDPVRLAEWVLKDQAGQEPWTRDRVTEAMRGPRATTRSVALARPVQVVLFYLTAAVMPADGAVWFAEDIYRHDQRLARALASR